MRPSDTTGETRRATGVMIASSPPGVEIQVLEGSLDLVARGSGTLTAELPEGIYLVRWIAGGQVHQEIHRLLAIPEPLILPQSDLPREFAAGTLAMQSPMADPSPRPSQGRWRSGEADIVIFVRSGEGVDVDRAEIGSLRLFDAHDVAMRFDPIALADEPASLEALSAIPVRLYHVGRGEYRIRFKSVSGAAFEQIVIALPDRRTLVFLQLSAITQVRGAGETLRPDVQVGVSAPATRLVSVAAHATTSQGAEQIRLAELLQHALAMTASPLDDATLAVLARSDTDPLLKLAGAVLILLRLEQNLSPGLENEVFETAARAGLEAASLVSGGSLLLLPFRALAKTIHGTISRSINREAARRRKVRWYRRACALVEAADPTWRLSDAIVLGWKLRSLGEKWDSPPPASISNPPMFEACWRWAVAETATRPEAVPNTRSIRAPSRGRSPGGPWLVWRASAAKELQSGSHLAPEAAIPTTGTTPTAGTGSGTLVWRLTEAAQSLNASASRDSEQARLIMSNLSVETRRLMANTTGSDTGGGTLTERLNRYAEALSAPTLVVAAQVEAAEREIAAAVSAEDGGPSSNAPPALGRAVKRLDDPNKGRFGRRARRQGFRLSAEFDAVEADWVKLTLIVTASSSEHPTDGLTAEFFLHDTFRPDRYVVSFVNGRAELEVTTWGGFTAGVWIADRAIELELDLAEVPGAPPVIRDL